MFISKISTHTKLYVFNEFAFFSKNDVNIKYKFIKGIIKTPF